MEALRAFETWYNLQQTTRSSVAAPKFRRAALLLPTEQTRLAAVHLLLKEHGVWLSEY
jgi:hypothetical protein